MRRLLRRLMAMAAVVVSLFVVTMSGASAAPTPTTGTVVVTVRAPEGIPATVTLQGPKGQLLVANKPAVGTFAVVTLTVPEGGWVLVAKPQVVDGRVYPAARPTDSLTVKAGRTSTVTSSYALDATVGGVHATAVGATSVTLTWTTTPGTTVVVRRDKVSATEPGRERGTPVPVSRGSATDTGLTPGTTYRYAIFANGKGGGWVGPVVLQVGTRSSDPTAATFVASPQTVILTAADTISAAPNGTGVTVVLDAAAPLPTLGAAVTLPVSTDLPGGYLGVVTALSLDGRTLTLRAAGLGDAFDYWQLLVPHFSAGDVIDPVPTSPGSAPGQQPAGSPTTKSTTTGKVTTAPAPAQPRSLLSPSAPMAPLAKPAISCGGSEATKVVLDPPLIAPSGHFSGAVDTYNVLGKDLPVGASFDVGYALQVQATASITAQANLSCSVPLDSVMVPLASTPVPVSAYLSTKIELTTTGSVKVANLGVNARAEIGLKGHLGLTSGAGLDASAAGSAAPTTPLVTTTGKVRLRVGGQLIIGPGAGTPKAGVVAGVSGELFPLDAGFGPAFEAPDPRASSCLKGEVAWSRQLSVTAKAWMPHWSASASLTADALKGVTPYPGSPWYWPTGCETGAAEPSDTVLGGGVSKVDDLVVGGADQWGYVPGFVPGKKTWVLSTGVIGNAVGSPSTLASTSLGMPGDSDLSALSGHPTYDAVAYQVTVVPTGSTLHVRYAFASEEYPEFVGSGFNDVMAVYVGGSNCALVGNPPVPVSINTVNADSNAGLYVDNSAGASGYGTTMDGLTRPLECQVPVTPGKPVSVKIAVADASDAILDSAVALLDQGIWSD